MAEGAFTCDDQWRGSSSLVFPASLKFYCALHKNTACLSIQHVRTNPSLFLRMSIGYIRGGTFVRSTTGHFNKPHHSIVRARHLHREIQNQNFRIEGRSSYPTHALEKITQIARQNSYPLDKICVKR